MAGIQPFSGGSTSRNLLDNSTNSSISDSQNPAEPTAQSNTAEQQFSGMTTEERLKSSQSPLDQFLSDTSQLASDTADAVTDLATDAYQGMKAINQEYALGQRAMGALKVLGGVGEAFVGGVGVMAPEPLTSVGGGILFVHGSDVASSGLQELLTGKPVETVTDQVATESAKLLGADDATAQKIGDGVDMGLSLGSAGVGAYQALTRPVVAELGPMTIKSSPKAEPASELNAGTKTQAGNDAALTAEVAESVGPAGKLQAVEGVSEVNAPEVTTTMRVGTNAPNTIKLSQAKVLRDIGVSKENRRAFFNGEIVDFKFPTKGGDDVIGFLQRTPDGEVQLTSQLFSINNTAGGAPAAFRKFLRNSTDLGKSLGAQKIEIQGGSLINPDLAKALTDRGFAPKTVPVPEALGGGTQDVLFKIIDLTKKN